MDFQGTGMEGEVRERLNVVEPMVMESTVSVKLETSEVLTGGEVSVRWPEVSVRPEVVVRSEVLFKYQVALTVAEAAGVESAFWTPMVITAEVFLPLEIVSGLLNETLGVVGGGVASSMVTVMGGVVVLAPRSSVAVAVME